MPCMCRGGARQRYVLCREGGVEAHGKYLKCAVCARGGARQRFELCRDGRSEDHGKDWWDQDFRLTPSDRCVPCGAIKSTRHRLCRDCFSMVHGKGSLPTQTRPCGVCRVDPHGKAFAVFRRSFAVSFSHTANIWFPVVIYVCNFL